MWSFSVAPQLSVLPYTAYMSDFYGVSTPRQTYLSCYYYYIKQYFLCQEKLLFYTIMNNIINENEIIYTLHTLKYLRNILIPVHHPVNLYILVLNLIQHYIISTNYILIISSKADPLSKIGSHIRKLLYILDSSIYLLYGLYCHLFIIFGNILFNILSILCYNRVNP